MKIEKIQMYELYSSIKIGQSFQSTEIKDAIFMKIDSGDAVALGSGTTYGFPNSQKVKSVNAMVIVEEELL